ncbi:Protein CDV3 like protein [Eufriesea mexicana]|uniref:protein CDV3 homolog n=1 Tax=Eufriesea mexicana TaxID=516756 RepID=UPI00083BE743|nr:PREDICTED: protein CDV3 homolog [Eufriesea mexicana]XP_017766838.1 PREDICTED: protein CDV3 homolog [Eufriesea mexicana]OAD61007.1 Protein CDV3 like protein [Eufriesea mexicana]
MADLDNFFAKKDRKKAKGKKFTTTEEIAKKLEETAKRLGKKSKDKSTIQEIEEIQQIEDEDEWREFEEEKKDYTGLKIGNLTLNESLDAESEEEKITIDNSCSDVESGESSGKHLGPWKKPELPPQPEVAEIAPPPPPVTSGSNYKPPHLRNIQAVAASPRPRAKNIAPDIHSEEYFPTLNSKQQQSNEPSGPWGRRKRDEGTFEEVRNRGGSRSYSVQDAQAQAPKLSLGNKYGALSQDQS